MLNKTELFEHLERARTMVDLQQNEDHPIAVKPKGLFVLEDRIRRLRAKADLLEALLGELPDELGEDADNALWFLVIGEKL